MIKKMSKCFRLNASEKQYIESIKINNTLTGFEWDSLKKTPEMVALKLAIRTRLRKIQNGYCAYCGNKYHVTSEDHIEHIAPKAPSRHPEWMFKEHNLVLACQYCNGFIKKGVKDTVAVKNTDYKKCCFKLVHPYFDNPDEHYIFTSADKRILISHKSAQGAYSIKMFKLDQIIQSEARAKDAIYHEYELKPAQERKIDLVLRYRAS